MISQTRPAYSFRASIENTDTGLPFREYGYHHLTKDEGIKSSFCYLEVEKGSPFAITIEMSPTFTRSTSDDWRAACFIDGQRLNGSYWNPDFREHRIDSVIIKKGEEMMKCKMRFGTIEKSDGVIGLKKEKEKEDGNMGRIDIVLSRGLWIPLEDIGDTSESSPSTGTVTEEIKEDPTRSVYATDPIKADRTPTKAMMFAEKADEPIFYSFHFIGDTHFIWSNSQAEDHPPPPPQPTCSLPNLSSRKKRRRDADDVDSEEEGDILHQLDILKARLKRSEGMNKRLITQNRKLRKEVAESNYKINILKSLRERDDTRTVV